jgi:DNA helicase-2/ATP-dependent DNA helicase PcrA
VDLLRRDSPAFSVDGPNASKTLKTMIDASVDLVAQLRSLWETGSIGDILRFCADKQIIRLSENLRVHLFREPRVEKYDEVLYVLEKGDWLADELLKMSPAEIPSYHSFISNNTAFSTQHGVKGEEYAKVLVVYDDVEANWNNYSFGKILTPGTAGKPTDGQLERGKKLAYVSFSRALTDLRVLLFAFDPTAARQELIDRQLVSSEQIEIVP